MQPNDAKIIAACITSALNATLCCAAGILDLCYRRLWRTMNEENEPWIAFYAWSEIEAYFVIDTIVEIYHYYRYKKTKHHRKFDIAILIHHAVSMTIFYALEVPKPNLFWFFLSLSMPLEFNTIFLNLMKISRYSASKQLRKYSKFFTSHQKHLSVRQLVGYA
eukprot:258896_1